MFEDEVFERTLCQLSQCHVFKIPVRKTADGHRAFDWPKEHTWTGKLKISAKGRLAVITLLDSNTNHVFATCSVTDDSCVERTLDSGRYFVLKIQNAQGRHAFIGIAFNERNDAFDFNVALQEHKAECEREDQAAAAPAPSGIPLRDLSIKTGEKITVKIAGAGAGIKKDKKPMATGGFLLPPPGSSGGRLAPPPADKGGHPVAFVSKPQVATAPAASVFDFGFGSSDPFSSSAPAAAPPTDAFGFPISSTQPNKAIATNKSNEPPNLSDF